jgi:ferredoxin-NADP reductase
MVVKAPVIVEEVIKHTGQVCSLILKPLKRIPKYKPGQFLHLALDSYEPSFEWPESRVFSIANSPTRREIIKITFAEKGKFTRRMLTEINDGDELWIKLPYGSFSFDNDDKDIVLIAGGTGITPYLSFLEYAIDNNLNSNIKLFYGVKCQKLIIFEDIISECIASLLNFENKIYLEDLVISDKQFRTGRLNIEEILNEIENIDNTIFYLSGPTDMVSNFKLYLLENRICESQIRIDKWE